MKKQLLLSFATLLCGVFSWAQPAQLNIAMHLSTSSSAIPGSSLPGYEVFIRDADASGSTGRTFYTDLNGNLIMTYTSTRTSGSGYITYEVKDCQNQIVATNTVNYNSPGAVVSFSDSINVPCVDPCDVNAGAYMRTTNEYHFYSSATYQRWDMSHSFWEFSDGTTATGRFVNKQFTALGTYTWKMTYQGCSIDSGSVVVTGTCDAGFTVDTATSIGGIVNMFNTSTATSSGNTLYYHWDFGDGTSSTQAFPQHQYSGNGPYMIYLSITEVDMLGDTICNSWHADTLGIDSAGNILKVGFTVNIQDPSSLGLSENDIASFSLYPQPATDLIRIEANSELQMAELVDLNGRVVQVWNFDDGNTSELKLNSHVSGMYVLRVRTAYGTSAQKCIIQ